MDDGNAELIPDRPNPRSSATMKRRSVLAGLALAVGLLATGSEAFAQGFSVTITVDENGHGTLTNTSGFFSALPTALLQDPGPGGLAGALTYGLLGPPGLVAGDLILLEPGTGVVSDIIRFNPNQTIGGVPGTLVFYSDNQDAGRDLADIGFPRALYDNNFTAFEVGPEGSNGISYTPTAGMPGFVTGAGGPVTYLIASDLAVPEPGPMALSAVAGVIGLVAVRLRRKRAAA
jgi:hypothetical protein